MSFLDFFKKKSRLQYELVESEIDQDTFRQGIRLTDSIYNGIVVTIDPIVKVKEDGDQLRVAFNFVIEANPHGIEVSMDELRPIIGDIIVDLMNKDYNA
jgi:hypothetical protein